MNISKYLTYALFLAGVSQFCAAEQITFKNTYNKPVRVVYGLKKGSEDLTIHGNVNIGPASSETANIDLKNNNAMTAMVLHHGQKEAESFRTDLVNRPQYIISVTSGTFQIS